MIQHVWTIPCRMSIPSADTNNITLVDVLEQITIPIPQPEKPLERGLFPALFDVVTLWARENDNKPATGFARLSFLGPDGAALICYEYPIDLSNNPRVRHTGRVIGFPTGKAGRYVFKVEMRIKDEDNWQEVHMLPLIVTIVRPEMHSSKN